MKIELKEPDGPYSAELDPGVMQVILTEVFNGVTLISPDGEHLAVCMRDSGFEVHYFAEYGLSKSDPDWNGFDRGWSEFKDGVIKHKVEV